MMNIGKKARFVIFAAILSLMSFLSYGRGIGVNAERFDGDAVAAEKYAGETGIHARAACVIELSSRRILFEKNGEEQLPMASTTKIATALTVLDELTENGDESRLDETFSVPASCCGVEGSSVYLSERGRRYHRAGAFVRADAAFRKRLRGNACRARIWQH